MSGSGVDQVDKARAAVEFGQKEGGIGLRLGVSDPLEARSDGAVVGAAFAEDTAAVAADTHGY